jgi:hypothetical protein
MKELWARRIKARGKKTHGFGTGGAALFWRWRRGKTIAIGT